MIRNPEPMGAKETALWAAIICGVIIITALTPGHEYHSRQKSATLRDCQVAGGENPTQIVDGRCFVQVEPGYWLEPEAMDDEGSGDVSFRLND